MSVHGSRKLMPRAGYDYFEPVAVFREKTKEVPGGSFSIFYPSSVIGLLYVLVDDFFQGGRFAVEAEIKNKKRLFKTTAAKEREAFLKAYKVTDRGPAMRAVALLVNDQLLTWLYGIGGKTGRARVNWYLAYVVRYILSAPPDLLVKGQGPFWGPAYEKVEVPTKAELLGLLSPDEMAKPSEQASFLNQSLFSKLGISYGELIGFWKEQERTLFKERQKEEAVAFEKRQRLEEALELLSQALAALQVRDEEVTEEPWFD